MLYHMLCDMTHEPETPVHPLSYVMSKTILADSRARTTLWASSRPRPRHYGGTHTILAPETSQSLHGVLLSLNAHDAFNLRELADEFRFRGVLLCLPRVVFSHRLIDDDFEVATATTHDA